MHELKGKWDLIDQEDPIEVLLEMARRGEVDPWDIDIARITERFLEYLDSMEERDLRIPARTLLYAAILLRMKSDSMEEPEDEIEEEPIEEWIEEPSGRLPKPPLRRRTKRPVTLDELISELKRAEMAGRRREARYALIQEDEIEEIQDVSHEEGIEERIASLLSLVEELFEVSERVSFQDVEGGDRALSYISLLFMAQRKHLWLEQEELFGELYLCRRLDGS